MVAKILYNLLHTSIPLLLLMCCIASCVYVYSVCIVFADFKIQLTPLKVIPTTCTLTPCVAVLMVLSVSVKLHSVVIAILLYQWFLHANF